VKLDRLDAVPGDELEDLIRQSYEMVAAKAPKKKPGMKKGGGEVRRQKKAGKKSRSG